MAKFVKPKRVRKSSEPATQEPTPARFVLEVSPEDRLAIERCAADAAKGTVPAVQPSQRQAAAEGVQPYRELLAALGALKSGPLTGADLRRMIESKILGYLDHQIAYTSVVATDTFDHHPDVAAVATSVARGSKSAKAAVVRLLDSERIVQKCDSAARADNLDTAMAIVGDLLDEAINVATETGGAAHSAGLPRFHETFDRFRQLDGQDGQGELDPANDHGRYTPRELATKYRISGARLAAFQQQLRRWAMKNPGSPGLEPRDNPRPNEPAFVFQASAVSEIIIAYMDTNSAD